MDKVLQFFHYHVYEIALRYKRIIFAGIGSLVLLIILCVFYTNNNKSSSLPTVQSTSERNKNLPSLSSLFDQKIDLSKIHITRCIHTRVLRNKYSDHCGVIDNRKVYTPHEYVNILYNRYFDMPYSWYPTLNNDNILHVSLGNVFYRFRNNENFLYDVYGAAAYKDYPCYRTKLWNTEGNYSPTCPLISANMQFPKEFGEYLYSNYMANPYSWMPHINFEHIMQVDIKNVVVVDDGYNTNNLPYYVIHRNVSNDYPCYRNDLWNGEDKYSQSCRVVSTNLSINNGVYDIQQNYISDPYAWMPRINNDSMRMYSYLYSTRINDPKFRPLPREIVVEWFVPYNPYDSVVDAFFVKSIGISMYNKSNPDNYILNAHKYQGVVNAIVDDRWYSKDTYLDQDNANIADSSEVSDSQTITAHNKSSPKHHDEDDPEHQREDFIRDELVISLLPNDDIVLGKLTLRAYYEAMDPRTYVKKLQQRRDALAAQPAHKKMLGLIDNFENVKPKKTKGTTAMYNNMVAAIKNGDIGNMRTIIKNVDFDINALDKKGDNLLAVATSYGHYNVAKFLIMHGIDIKHKNSQDQDAYDIAVLKHHDSIASLITQATTKH